MSPLIPWLFIILAIVAIAKSMVQVRPEQRVVVLRFGRYQAYWGPGLTFIVPFYDQARIVELDQFAGWRALPEEKIRDLVLENVFGASRDRT